MSRRFTYYGSYLSTPAYDADAQAYFDKIVSLGGAITDDEKTYTNTLVLYLKANSLWTSFNGKYLYPLRGGSATSQRVNLINPETFLITWAGGITHDNTGVTGDGTGYGLTGYIPNDNELYYNNGHGCYSRTNSAVTQSDYGSFTNVTADAWIMHIKWSDSKTYWASTLSALLGSFNIGELSTGLYDMSQDGVGKKLYREGVLKRTHNYTILDTQSIRQVGLMCRMNNVTPEFYSQRNYSLFMAHDYLDETQSALLSTGITNFMTSLGINV